MKNIIHLLLMLLVFSACKQKERSSTLNNTSDKDVTLIVLGNVQDAGSPHIACAKACCKALFANPDKSRRVVSLGLIDAAAKTSYIFDATPDLPTQMKTLKSYAAYNDSETPDGIFLTHAHIGHYTGLMYLGKEAMNARELNVYTMPRMKTFLEQNGPWNQLVEQKNISMYALSDRKEIQISGNVRIMPFVVPHRDEYSETVGYRISGPNKSALFIPDIDKWEKWDKHVVHEIAGVDYVFIDGTFYDAAEVNHRDISEIPHPFITESMGLFSELAEKEKSKIYFIHFNHTNPVLNSDSRQSKQVENNGFHVARIHDTFRL